MSVRLRCNQNMKAADRQQLVEETLATLGLAKAANTYIGNGQVRGVSGGERKRAHVATELVTDPAVLFLDEPTTGLDTLSAVQLMTTMREVARRGRTVVTTLHQPSSELLETIDNLIFMAGGRVIYAGPIGSMIAYFARLGLACPAYCNPTDFLFLSLFRSPDAEDELDSMDKEARERSAQITEQPVTGAYSTAIADSGEVGGCVA